MADKNLQKIYDKFDHDVFQMIIHAKAANINAGVDCLYPESFVIGILTTGQNSVNSVLIQYKVDLENCLMDFKASLLAKKNPKNTDEEIINYENLKKSKQLVEVCYAADKINIEINNKDQSLINLQHIFLAILNICPDIKNTFKKHGLNINEFVSNLRKNRSSKKIAKKKTEEQQKTASVFDSFCTNMTELAAKNKYDPIISRDEEIENAITVLCRRNKSNPILVGAAGTGKTAIVEGICQRIVSGTVPKKLQGSKVYSLNIGALVAGTKYRGEFETRLQTLIKTLLEDPSAILFIDEIHNIIGAGAVSGSNDAANMLKPALARNLKCIGATTDSEYKKHFSGEAALERRFEKIDVDEPTTEQVKKILLGIAPKLEEFHKCKIGEDAIDMAVSLTERYLPSKHFPDKAIDCIDTACAKYAWKDTEQNCITAKDIAAVVSKQCQIPIEVVTWGNKEIIENTEKTLYSRVIGEDHVIQTVCRTIKNAYSGVRNPNKPIGIFVFGGQSGTGKTYIAKELAKILFSSDSSLIRIDMTEFSEPHSISKITGSPPGYVGFNDTDVIADKIKRKPYCVLLLDEIEKAHPDVMKLFLQVMSDGMFTDSMGNKINCKNILLIMTGNFGMNDKGKDGIGFSDDESKTDIDKEQVRLVEFCKKNYGAEFANRVDNFVPFVPLNNDSLLKIINLQLNEFLTRITNKNYTIKFTEFVSKKLLELSKEDHGLNATMINRLISKNIEPIVSDCIFENMSENADKHMITIDFKNGKFIAKGKKNGQNNEK
jgi:ATP-dependent Clp protease ATP-binding subunit ClpA